MIENVWRGFASDNYAGIHPEVLAAITVANVGHQSAYGDDEVTAKLQSVVELNFGSTAKVFPVFNGTGANVTALQAMLNSWEAVICADTAHINVDEGGAPEKVAGLKLWTVPNSDGKLTPELIRSQAFDFGSVHRAQQRAVSITQSTELGTVYSIAELKEIVKTSHELGLYVHLDGARIANGAAALGVTLKEMTTDVGIDVVSFGGTKNGAMGAEAVIALNPEALPHYEFVRKSAMQLASKMRFISAQLIALLENDLWLRNAQHANKMAGLLASEVSEIPGVVLPRKVEANAVFPILPAAVTEKLQQDFKFYTWNQSTGEVRWMCSWDTTADDVQSFVAAVRTEMKAYTS
jgi:threonine aldolase